MYELLMKLKAYAELITAVSLIYLGVTFQYHTVLVDIICVVTGVCLLMAAAKTFDKINGYGQQRRNRQNKT